MHFKAVYISAITMGFLAFQQSNAEELSCPAPEHFTKSANQAFAEPKSGSSIKHCFLSSTEARELQFRDWTIIDTRHPDAIQEDPVVGALAIKRHHLPDKTFLKPHKLLLIGNPFERFELLKTCDLLHQDGFQTVKVIPNGAIGLGESVRQISNIEEIEIDAFLYEYKNQLAKVVFFDKELQKSMAEFGVKGDLARTSMDKNALDHLKAVESENGVLPIVMLGSDKDIKEVSSRLNGQIGAGIYSVSEPLNKFEAHLAKYEQARRVGADELNRQYCE